MSGLDDAPARPPRRAIVLGAGGVIGFAWTLGALSALESVAGFDARESDVIVGTSAGSVAAGLLGCGLPVAAIRRHHQGRPDPADPVIAYDYASTGAALPPAPRLRPGSPGLVVDALRHPGRVHPGVALSGLLPHGRGTLAGVRALVAGVARDTGFAERWPDTPQPWIVAADYRSGRRTVFGREPRAAAARAVGVPSGRVGLRARHKAAPAGGSRPVRRAPLDDAVIASCSIPGWYPPVVIDGVPHIDGGTLSNASVDLLHGTGVAEVYVLAPMACIDVDRPRSAAARLERRVRAAVTRRILDDVARLRAEGARVCVITPGPADLQVMGLNLMDPRRRKDVLETATRTASVQLARQLSSSHGWGTRVTRPRGVDPREAPRSGQESA